MLSRFGSSDSSGSSRGSASGRVPRHSSGWNELLKHLRSQDSLRILDIGPTSSTNINYITDLGHSIYMANLVEEASKPEWRTASAEGGEPVFDVDRFLEANLNFSGRVFDVVIFWDTADYLPEPLVAPVLSRLHKVLQPGGLMLAFFHQASAPETHFCRYHLTDTDVVEMQKAGNFPIVNIYNNRKIENMLSEYANFRFFLAKDSLREVIITR
jgi:SAM-dependent methyltransferase